MTIAFPARPRLHGPDDLCEVLGIAFSEQQLAAITAPLSPGVIIAGAGSGKTTVMAARVVWLVGTGQVLPEQVLGLTFTRKAAAELSARVRTALQRLDLADEDAGEQVIMTYDAFAARIVSEHGLRIGVDAEPVMITGATRYRLASRVVRAAAGPFEHLSRIRPSTVTDRVLRLDTDLQSHLVSHEELDRHAREYQLALAQAPTKRGGLPYVDVVDAAARAEQRLELAQLVGDYAALKRRLGVVEFADQMAVAAELARTRPEVSAMVRDTFRVVLLDEYQDTSAAQATMLAGLFSGADQVSGRGHPVTAVGDPFQAIYGWRGAAASNILQFASDFPDADGHPAATFTLTVNRRSGQSILDVANVVARALKAETGLEQTDLVASPEAGRGQVRTAMFETWPEEVSWIGDQIVAAREHDEAARWSDIAVLTRRNEDIGTLYRSLTAREIPCEIVGLGGLLTLPEISDVVATLRLLDDVTANPDLIRLLTGPRWRIGPRDLALLGRRARELAEQRDPAPASVDDALTRALDEAVAEVDPTEITSLLDALDDPGEADYSVEARQRFAAFADELGRLRRHVEEPVLDLTRRVVATLGLDVELVATDAFVRTGRRDQLAAFLDAIADYVDVDGDASLAGLLAWLQAEIDTGNGLDQAVPTDEDSVKLLTVHKAKGLEWTCVFLPALVQGVFPSDRLTDNWVKNPAVVPGELRGDADAIPQLGEASRAGMGEYDQALRGEQKKAEDRLAYVAITRARRVLVASGHVWRPQNQKPRQPSSYLRALEAEARAQGRVLAEVAPPAPDAANPLIVDADPVPWPPPLDADAFARRQEAAAFVRGARAGEDEPLLLDAESQVAQWDADLALLISEARAARTPHTDVALPWSISATELLRARADPAAYAADLARPMPQPPSRSARFGTRFHRWVERHVGQQTLVDPDDLPGGEDGIADDLDLAEVCRRFAEGQFGARSPMALEAPFTLALGGRSVRGRIDAVYRDLPATSPYRYLVVDWKTGRRERVDEWQLALYRLAWAELHDVDVEQVDACFYFVRDDQVMRPRSLPGRAELEQQLALSGGQLDERE